MNDDPSGAASLDRFWTEPLNLRVQHLTRYIYRDTVWDSFNEARLQPVSDTTQDCREFALEVQPSASFRVYPDFHGNSVHYFDVTQPHQQLDVTAVSLVQTKPDSRGDTPPLSPQAALKQSDMLEDYFDFLHDSEFVSLGTDVWREAVDALPDGPTDLWLDTLKIGHHIFKNFTYTPKTTTVNTKPAEVVNSHTGVCQDFAHVMLGMCRSHGIPARYVSGYFYNPSRNPGDIEASHAWVEVFLPGHGWKGFDPTHDRVPDTRYVKIAVGRDYSDIRPVSGTFRGKGTREMVVEVHVLREATLAGA